MVINIALRFVLEVCALVILGYWGFQIGESNLMKFLLGIGTPLLIAIIWGAFGSPAAQFPVEGFARLILEIFIFGLATLALYSTGKVSIAIIYAILVVVNRFLMYVWNQ